MNFPVRYIGTVDPFFETAITGQSVKWGRGDTDARSEADAELLVASGLFEQAFDGAAVVPILAATFAAPAAAMLADTRTFYELQATKALYRSNGASLEPVGETELSTVGQSAQFGVLRTSPLWQAYEITADGVVISGPCRVRGVRCLSAGTFVGLYDALSASGTNCLPAGAMTAGAEALLSGSGGVLFDTGVYVDVTGGTYWLIAAPAEA